MHYPLQLKFKAIALANQVSVTDAMGSEIMYVKQKAFKLKEKIEIFRDSSRSELMFVVGADRVIDFSPELIMRDTTGNEVGSVKRHGRKSILRASYDVSIGGTIYAHVSETSPWAKVWDALFSEIPIVGLFAGYVFHPAYKVTRADGADLATIKKLPAFLEGKFELEAGDNLAALDETTQQRLALLLMVVTLYERLRG
ncbi:MAG TPA: hypothetical protein VM124_01640 [Candidatus Limnocylindrales bacterium]|nr:hypothetical protein [Candidatus Limnocylindrales bacterium]